MGIRRNSLRVRRSCLTASLIVGQGKVESGRPGIPHDKPRLLSRFEKIVSHSADPDGIRVPLRDDLVAKLVPIWDSRLALGNLKMSWFDSSIGNKGNAEVFQG